MNGQWPVFGPSFANSSFVSGAFIVNIELYALYCNEMLIAATRQDMAAQPRFSHSGGTY
jgi:hypothetical protein